MPAPFLRPEKDCTVLHLTVQDSARPALKTRWGGYGSMRVPSDEAKPSHGPIHILNTDDKKE